MRSIKRLMLSPATVLLLIALALTAVAIAGFIPQGFVTDKGALAAWRSAHPALASVAETLGLFHVFTSLGFAVILLFSLVSLTLSTLEQVRGAWRKTFGDQGGFSGVELPLEVPLPEAHAILARAGYLRLGRGEGMRLVRHPWGYWGNALLHCGMVVTIAASLFIALTQQRGLVRLFEGETFQPGHPWLSAEQGILARELRLPEGVGLDRVEVRFARGGAIERIASTLSFFTPGGGRESGTTAVNSILTRGGTRIYQGTSYGHAFYLETSFPEGGQEIFRLPIQHPVQADEASYLDFHELLGPGLVLRTKYFADVDKRTLGVENPLLVLRLDRQGHEVGRLPLRVGGEGAIGTFRFRLMGVNRWTQLIFVRLAGISVVFAGFFILLLGGALHYVTPPREIRLVEDNEGCVLTWRAARFADFYADEPASLAAAVLAERKV